MTGQAKRLASEPELVVSPAHPVPSTLARTLRGISILTIPSLAVATTLAMAWQSSQAPFELFDGVLSPAHVQELYPSLWLTWGHALVPCVFLIANLVNRRYGERMTSNHVLASWAVSALVAIGILSNVIPLETSHEDLPSLRHAISFFAAMIMGQLVGTYVFERTRGVAWWNAPAYSALASSLIAVPVYYLLAFGGSNWIWVNRMTIDLGLKAFMSFALLVPYFLLRPIIRPLTGLGGY